jgi:hypothetical protein
MSFYLALQSLQPTPSYKYPLGHSSLALRRETDPQLFRRLPEVLTMAITVAAIGAFERPLATVPQKDDTARALTRRQARLCSFPWGPSPRPGPRSCTGRSRCGEQLKPQLAHSLPEVLTWR